MDTETEGAAPVGEIHRPEGFSIERDGPRTFSFDDVSYPCFPLGSFWNGFDNVSVSPQTRDLIIADWKAIEDFDQETVDDLAALEIEEDGRICLGWCYATVLDEETAAA